MTDIRPLLIRMSHRINDPPKVRSAQVMLDAPDPIREYRESDLIELLGLDLRKATLVIEPSFYCNLACNFCDLPVQSRISLDWQRALTPILAMTAVGLSRVQIVGGEPALYPQIMTMISDLKELKLQPWMFTHGLWAKSYQKVEKFIQAGITGMTVSIKSFTDESFLDLTRVPGRTRSHLKAFDNLIQASKAGKLKLDFNHVITQKTMDEMTEPNWVDSLPDLPYLVLSMVEPYRDDMRALSPDPYALREALPKICAALDQRGIPFQIEGAPFCMLGEWAHKSRDTGRHDDNRARVNFKPLPEADYLLAYRGYQRIFQFKHVEACGDCTRSNDCLGLHKRYAHWWPADVVRPIGKHR